MAKLKAVLVKILSRTTYQIFKTEFLVISDKNSTYNKEKENLIVLIRKLCAPLKNIVWKPVGPLYF